MTFFQLKNSTLVVSVAHNKHYTKVINIPYTKILGVIKKTGSCRVKIYSTLDFCSKLIIVCHDEHKANELVGSLSAIINFHAKDDGCKGINIVESVEIINAKKDDSE